jgi:hypothetical protein
LTYGRAASIILIVKPTIMVDNINITETQVFFKCDAEGQERTNGPALRSTAMRSNSSALTWKTEMATEFKER